jgi:hypothetical protein
MAMTITTQTADAMLAAFAALCNTGPVRIYSGTAPTNASTALSDNTMLAEATMGATAFSGTYSTSGNNRVATANAITADSSADASGTATFFRVFQSGGTIVVYQGSVGTSSADMIMAATDLIAGGNFSISSLTVAIPMV